MKKKYIQDVQDKLSKTKAIDDGKDKLRLKALRLKKKGKKLEDDYQNQEQASEEEDEREEEKDEEYDDEGDEEYDDESD